MAYNVLTETDDLCKKKYKRYFDHGCMESSLMQKSDAYLMEDKEETFRLELKTIPDDVRSQALWCGR